MNEGPSDRMVRLTVLACDVYPDVILKLHHENGLWIGRAEKISGGLMLLLRHPQREKVLDGLEGALNALVGTPIPTTRLNRSWWQNWFSW